MYTYEEYLINSSFLFLFYGIGSIMLAKHSFRFSAMN
jgi:hypothetical protein